MRAIVLDWMWRVTVLLRYRVRCAFFTTEEGFENGVWIYLLRADGAFMRSAAAAAA